MSASVLKGTKVFKMGDQGLLSWYSSPEARKETIDRCDKISAKFECVVELLNESEGILYKVFPTVSH